MNPINKNQNKNHKKKTKKQIQPNKLENLLRQTEFILLGLNPVQIVSTDQTQSHIPTPTSLEASIARTHAAHHICMLKLHRIEQRYKDILRGTKISQRNCMRLKATIKQLEAESVAEKQLTNVTTATTARQHDNTSVLSNTNQPVLQMEKQHSNLVRQAGRNRSIDVNGIQYNMMNQNELKALVSLARNDSNVLQLIERRMKARQRRYLADTLSYTNATTYMRGESLNK